MPGSLCTCPDCHARIKLAENRPAGKHVKCPKCNTLFAIPALEEAPEVEAGRVPRRRSGPFDEEAERRPRRRDRSASAGIEPATLALIIVLVTVGALLLLAGSAWLVLRGLKPREEVVAGAPGGAKSVAPNPVFRPGNQPAPPTVARGTQVGALALEIEGEDIDGNRFRLSDYQGKVVLLDFWGNW